MTNMRYVTPISNSLHLTLSKTVIRSSLHLKNIEDLWCKTVSGKFFEVNKGSNQHQKFIEDHDDEGYGGESDDDDNDGDDENGDHDGDGDDDNNGGDEMLMVMLMTLTMKIKSLFVPQEEQSPKLAINLIECCRIVKFNCENM